MTEAEAYRFATDEIELDLDRFDELLERSARQPTREARRSLDQALGLARGEVLEDEPYALWAQDLRRTYQGRVLGARIDAAEAALAELDYGGALAHAQAASALDAFGERAARLQMLALYALGRQHEALETYRRFRARLEEELGLAPTAETRSVETAILRQEDLRTLLPRPIEHSASPAAIRLLGRKTELAVLEQAVHDALDRSFALAAVEGEAGFGKTRLLCELATMLVGVRVGQARCSRLEQHLPYVPLAAALRDAIGEDEIRRAGVPALGRVFPELLLEADTDAVTHDLSEVEVLEALVGLVTARGPAVLILDDLHCADPATIAAVSYLRRRCASVPGAIVVAIRDEEAPPEHPLHGLKTDVLVRLEPLTPSELAPLGMADLHASTEGHPGFVVETVAARGDRPLETAFNEALIAQCRAEGALAYRALVTASVLEEAFDVEPLARLVRTDPLELVEELDRLCERRILRVDGPRFRFRYPIVREALAASLSPARRQMLDALLQTDARSATSSRRARPGTLVPNGR